MSHTLELESPINSTTVQMWNNAVFDSEAKENWNPSSFKPPPIRDFDGEMEEIQAEIRRLSLKLESIRLEKIKHITTSMIPRPSEINANRRKSCFYRLEETHEVIKVKDTNGRRLSLNPKSAPSLTKTPGSKHKQSTTIVEEEKRHVIKSTGRVVPSRYTHTQRNIMPGNHKGKDTKVITHAAVNNPHSNLRLGVSLPKIRTKNGPCTSQTPRDSGPAKKVADLMGNKRSFFAQENGIEEASLCRILSFDHHKC